MIKKAREWVSRLYELERFKDNHERLIHIRHLIKDHTYSVRKLDREQLAEVCLHCQAVIMRH
jgi:hypothetical protein